MERTERRSCAAPIVLLAAGAVIGGALVFALALAGLIPGLGQRGAAAPAALGPTPVPPAAEQRYVRELPVPLLDSDTTTADTLLTVQSYVEGETRTTLLYLEGDRRAIRWESPPLRSASYEQFVQTDAERVYIADGPRLLALARADGATVWERTLSDTILNSCRDCLQLAGGRVIALTQDGVLEAFDAASGAATWRARLNETPRQVVVLGDAVGVLDYPDSSGVESSLLLFGAADGRRLPAVETFCFADDGATPGRTPGIYDRLFPDAGALYVLVESDCVLKLGERGEVVWRTSIEETALQRWDDGELVITPEAVFTGVGGGLVELDARSGALRLVLEATDYEVTPLAARDGVVLVEALRTRGSRRAEIWGIDAASGERLWGQVLIGSDRFVDRMDRGDWSGRLVPGGYAVIQLAEDDQQYQVNVLRLSDGEARVSATIPHDGSGSSSGVAWSDDAAWIAHGRVYVVDLPSGGLRYAWP